VGKIFTYLTTQFCGIVLNATINSKIRRCLSYSISIPLILNWCCCKCGSSELTHLKIKNKTIFCRNKCHTMISMKFSWVYTHHPIIQGNHIFILIYFKIKCGIKSNSKAPNFKIIFFFCECLYIDTHRWHTSHT